MSTRNPQDKYLGAARRIFQHLAEVADARFCIKLWDNSIIPLGDKADPDFYISIKGPSVLGGLLRRPTLENLVRQYATGNIDFHGSDLISFYETVRRRGQRSKGVSTGKIKKRLRKGLILREALPLLFVPGDEKKTGRALLWR